MANYSKTTNFTAKDSLASGNPQKVILGADHDTEYDNIETAVATKADKISGGTDGNIVSRDASGNIADTGLTQLQVTNSWVEIYNLSTPITLGSAWQENVIDSATYKTYKLFMTWTQSAASTILGLCTISATPDGANVYTRASEVYTLNAAPGPTTTGSAGQGNFFDSSVMDAGPLAGFAEIRINVNPTNGQLLFFDISSNMGSFGMAQFSRYLGGSGNVDGLQFQADANTTLQTLVVLGLRNG